MSQIRNSPVPWTSVTKASFDSIEQFRSLDSLLINHGFSLKQVLTNIHRQPKYAIFNNAGEQMFSVFEESDLMQQICCTNERAFTIHVLDNASRELIQVNRDSQICSGCCCLANCENCKQQVSVECPPGRVIGTVEQQYSMSGMNYAIKDINNASTVFIMGPCCICNGAYSCGCENKYTILGTDRITEIGSIDKKYLDSIRLSTANPVAFTLNFPMNLDAQMKVLVLAAVFLIDIGNYKPVRLRR